MARTKSYIPGEDNPFNTWQNNLVDTVTANSAIWNIQPARLADLQGERTTYQPLYNAIINKNDRTKAQVTAHRTGRKKYMKFLRQFVREHLAHNSALSDGDRIGIGLTVRKSHRSVRVPINDPPLLRLDSLQGCILQVSCRRDKDENRTSMHPDADDVEVRYILSDTPIESVTACNQIVISTRSRFILRFEQLDAGKYCYAFARWRVASHAAKNSAWSHRAARMVAG